MFKQAQITNKFKVHYTRTRTWCTADFPVNDFFKDLRNCRLFSNLAHSLRASLVRKHEILTVASVYHVEQYARVVTEFLTSTRSVAYYSIIVYSNLWIVGDVFYSMYPRVPLTSTYLERHLADCGFCDDVDDRYENNGVRTA